MSFVAIVGALYLFFVGCMTVTPLESAYPSLLAVGQGAPAQPVKSVGDAVYTELNAFLAGTKLGWRKFRRRISEFCYVDGIFTGHNTARSASLNSASVGRMKMLQRRKIGRDLARIANLAQLIPASCTDCITVLYYFFAFICTV